MVGFQFYGSIRAAAGKDGDEIAAAGKSVYEALRLLPLQEEIFWPSDEVVREDLTILINGAVAQHSKLKEIKLKQNDIVSLLPSFTGGG